MPKKMTFVDLEEDSNAMGAQMLVESENTADRLAHMVVEDDFHPYAKSAAAKKLIKLWKDGRQGGVTLDHLTYVGDHADEPYKSEANQIIGDNL